MPNFHQHVFFATRDDKVLDYKQAYKILPHLENEKWSSKWSSFTRMPTVSARHWENATQFSVKKT
jgi:hypothetical protein